MISEGELLQANVTIITGILIFLTLAPISSGIVYEIVVRKYILEIVIYAIILFAGSMLSLLFPYELRIFSLKFKFHHRGNAFHVWNRVRGRSSLRSPQTFSTNSKAAKRRR